MRDALFCPFMEIECFFVACEVRVVPEWGEVRWSLIGVCDLVIFPPGHQSRSYCQGFEAWVVFNGLTDKWDV